MKTSLRNFILYNVGWFACVFFAADGRAWLGIATVALVATAHLLSAADWRREAVLLGLAALVGFTWESALVHFGVLAYPSAPGIGSLAPAWIVALWINFATTLNVSLAWLQRSPWLGAAFGAIGGPLAFLAGAGMGAVRFTHPATGLLVLGAGWAVLLPLLSAAAKRLSASSARAAGFGATHKTSLLEQAHTLLTGRGLDR